MSLLLPKYDTKSLLFGAFCLILFSISINDRFDLIGISRASIKENPSANNKFLLLIILLVAPTPEPPVPDPEIPTPEPPVPDPEPLIPTPEPPVPDPVASAGCWWGAGEVQGAESEVT